MRSNEKGRRSPCQQVIAWRIDQPDCDEAEARKLRTIRENGVTEAEEAELLASACKTSGMRAECEHADEC
ncbi:hypothetical protein [Natronomonas marina]|jgi:hypothetical protein|uniref:hypothetical protein n=1 Tax=Natronomonas marina TaxID=2961939 RepID=UPI0020C9CD2C|nr:hypothetical protein [Natronomonas marina]